MDQVVKVHPRLPDVLEGADQVYLSVPSQSLRENLRIVRELIPEGVPVVSLMKGVERSTRQRMSEVIQQELEISPDRIAVVSGPNLALEIAKEQPTAAVVSSTSLATALANGELVSFKSKEFICKEGSPAQEMYIIIGGQVRVLRKDHSAKVRELARLGAPSLIGEMGLIDGSVRSATCVALGQVTAIRIEKEIFKSLISEASAEGSAFRHQLLSVMGRQLSRTNEKIRDFLCDEKQEHGIESADNS